MPKLSLHQLLLTASSLGIITLVAVPPVYAGTLTIAPDGTIYTEPTLHVLGDATPPATITPRSKIKVVNQAKTIELKTVQGNKIRLETTPTGTTVAKPIAEEDDLIFIQKVATSEAKTRIMSKAQSKYMITNGIAAKVGTPLSFNLETNQMTVTTPAGTKIVAVLPDAALQKARLGTQIDVDVPTASDSSPISTDSAEIESSDSAIGLVDYQNSPTYTIRGKAKKNVLGFIPVSLDKTVYVSAVSGNIVKVDQPLFAKFLESISF